VADVLIFYQERIANEAFLRTALERRSLVELGRLIDYELRPGVAAEAYLAFSLEETPGAPPRLELNPGIKVQSVPGPGEQPQTFETVQSVEARVEWNALKPQTFLPHLPFFVDCYLEGVDLNLRPGDALLFVGEEAERDLARDNWDIRVIETVERDVERNLTRVTWDEPLGSVVPRVLPAANPEVHVFRRRVAVFGHNAPLWRSMSREFKDAYEPLPRGGSHSADWPNYVISPGTASVDLDTVVQQLMPGSWLALSKPSYVELYRVTDVSEVSRAEFGISAKVTRAALSGENYELFDNEVRATTVFAVNEQLRFSGRPVRAPVFGSTVTLAGDARELQPGQPLAFAGKRAHLQVTRRGEALDFVTGAQSRRLRLGDVLEVMAPPRRLTGGQLVPVTPEQLATVTARWEVRDQDGVLGHVDAGPNAFDLTAAPLTAEAVSELGFIDGAAEAVTVTPGRTRLLLASPLQHCYDLASLGINANVARATHGESVLQMLGSGDASKPHQRFELKSLPLTFVSAENETGAASTLTVRVNDIAWSEQPSLIDAGPRDRAYTLRVQDDGTAVVQFGDGQRGARLPSQGSVLASYRRGIGRAGNVGQGQLSQLLTRPLGLKAVTNPAPAEGGTDPDDAASARQTMPLGVRTLGRAVSLRDYEDFARAFTGIGKAHAAVLNLKAGRTVFITVAGEEGAALSPTNPVLTRLVGALRSSGDPLVRFEVQPYRAAHFNARLRVKRDPAHAPEAVFAAIEDALHAAFSFEAREFGQSVALSEVVAVADGVPGVVAVDVEHCYRGTARRLQRRIAAEQPHADAAGKGVPAELLTLAPGPLEWLGEMP